jgi:hypothetical protein
MRWSDRALERWGDLIPGLPKLWSIRRAVTCGCAALLCGRASPLRGVSALTNTLRAGGNPRSSHSRGSGNPRNSHFRASVKSPNARVHP